MQVILRFLLLSIGLLCLSVGQVLAIETKARAALVLDYTTGTVLLEKNADQSLPPASMSKLMTLNMVFEALDDGRLTLDEKLPVSKHAMSYGGSTMFLTTRDKVRVEDLIQGVIVLSGNDACVVLAEALAGTETEFARAMTDRARQLGMTKSTFANSNGWPDPNQRMSARDLVTLATRLITVFPQYYGYFSEKEFPFDGRAPANHKNRNPLLSLDIGADGLKTGHTKEAGYGVVGSAVRNGRRVVLMVSGLESSQERASESAKLTNWAFRQFVEKKIFDAGQTIGNADVWLGLAPSVKLAVKDDVSLLLPAGNAKKLSAKISLREPIEAPIEMGQELGRLKIDITGMDSVDVPLVAAHSVPRSGFMARVRLSAALLARSLLDLFN